MQTLFIDRKDALLEVDRGRLQVRIKGVRPNFSVPLGLLEMLVVGASVQFSSTLLTRLTQAGVTTVFINPRKVEGCTMTYGMMHNNAERRYLQYRAIDDADLRLSYSRQLVRDKLRAQRGFLKQALGKRPECRYALNCGIARIGGMIERIDATHSADSLLGIEGAAGAAYFEAYRTLFAPALGFHGRNRRPPRDPVNVILSLSFTLLHAEAVRALFSIGFDPMLGVYHRPCFGRESLACDLVELFRPLAERWIWALFADEILRPEYFTMENTQSDLPCMLGKRGREVYYAHYQDAARGWRRLMRRVARNWLARLYEDLKGESHGIG